MNLELSELKIHEKRIPNLTLIVLVGNIGLGKSTTSKHYVNKGYTVASYDAIGNALMCGITGNLHGSKYAKSLKKIYEYTIHELLENGISVIADDLNLRKSERIYLCRMAKAFNAQTFCIDFGNGTKEGLARRSSASNSFDYQGFDIMYQDLKNKYQKPSKEEGFDIIIKSEELTWLN